MALIRDNPSKGFTCLRDSRELLNSVRHRTIINDSKKINSFLRNPQQRNALRISTMKKVMGTTKEQTRRTLNRRKSWFRICSWVLAIKRSTWKPLRQLYISRSKREKLARRIAPTKKSILTLRSCSRIPRKRSSRNHLRRNNKQDSSHRNLKWISLLSIKRTPIRYVVSLNIPSQVALSKVSLSNRRDKDSGNKPSAMAQCNERRKQIKHIHLDLILLFNTDWLISYIGDWKSDKRCGKGIQIWPDGTL